LSSDFINFKRVFVQHGLPVCFISPSHNGWGEVFGRSGCRGQCGGHGAQSELKTQLFDSYTGQVLKVSFVFATVCSTIFRDKVWRLYFFLAASLITTIVQIIIEAVMVARYNNGGSQQWLSGCEILSACTIEQGPSSAMSQIYNEVENMMKIVIAEIVGNVIGLFVTIYTTCQIRQALDSSAQAPNPTSGLTVCLVVFEMLLESGQVACSALALQSMDGSIKPVNELFSSLVGKHSGNAGLCVLPCCGSSRNIITC
jgi:hypothetical protein